MTELAGIISIGFGSCSSPRGPFSRNRYRTKNALVNNLFAHFPKYVKSEAATIEWGSDHFYNGWPSLHFHGYMRKLGFDLAYPHSDWVGLEWVNRSVGFTVVTLGRNFRDAAEDGIAGATVGGSFGGVVGTLLGLSAVDLNRKHFLAGRRSWRIDKASAFGLAGDILDLYVFETIAVERFSSWVYDKLDSGLSLEDRLPDVWISLLNNFTLEVAEDTFVSNDNELRPRWKRKRKLGAEYVTLSFESNINLVADPEFQNAIRLYPTILP
jgi:hypothetical protein